MGSPELKFTIPEGVEPDMLELATATQTRFITNWVRREVTARGIPEGKQEIVIRWASDQGLVLQK